MATYLQGVTDQVPNIQPFQPNFGLVQQALSTLQAKYDRGFASVQNAYNQVLNAPLTNSKLKEYRDLYIKDSEKRLKDLSSVDLSLYENQAVAENVFAPFWEDERFLTDTYLTKSMQSELQRGLAMRDSKEEKEREQYDDISMRYLQNGLNEIAETDPDSADFKRIQARRWVPFKNLQKYLDGLANESKLEINWQSGSGPYLIDVKNGERALIPFETWAHNMLGNNFAAQFGVMGMVEREEGMKVLMANNPTLTKEQAKTLLAVNTLETLDKGYEKRGKELEDNLKNVDTQLEWYANRTIGTEEDADYVQLANSKLSLTDLKEKNKKEYDNFKNNYTATLTKIEQDPDGYFASANKQRVIDGWSAARASNQSVKITLDPLFEETNQNHYKREELDLKYKELDLRQKMFMARLEDTDGDGEPDTYRSSSKGGGASNGDGKSKKPQTLLSGHMIGKGITDVSKTGSAYEALMRHQNNRWDVAHNNFFDMDGVGRVITTKLGESESVSRDYISELRRKISDPDYKIDNKDNWFTTISKKLEEKAGFVVGEDAVAARNALIAITGTYLSEKLQGGGKLMDVHDREMVRKYLIGKNALQQYEATQKNVQEEIEKVFNTSHDYDVMRQDHGGKPGIITSDDLAKMFKSKTYTINGTDISSDQLAKFYMNGEVEVDMPKHAGRAPSPRIVSIVKGGNKLVYNGSFYDDGSDLYGAFVKLDEKYGSSKEFKGKLDALNKKIVPGILEYQNETGKYGYEMKYALRPDVDDEFSVTLLNEAANPDNRIDIYEDKESSEDDDMKLALQNILEQSETTLEKYVSSIVLNPTGINGNPTLSLTFIPVKETDQTKIADYDLTKLAGKHISIELNPSASGPAIQSIRTNGGFYIHGDLLRGKEIKSDPILKAAGFDFSVLPDDSKNPQRARIKIKRTVFDATTGQNKPLKTIEEDFLFTEKTPDEAMSIIYGLLEDHLKGNLEANERYEEREQVGGKTGKQRFEEIKRRYILSKINGQ